MALPLRREQLAARTKSSSSVSPPGTVRAPKPSHVRSHSRFRWWRSELASKRFSTTAEEEASGPNASRVSRTALIVPRPASATSNTTSGSSATHRARQSPSAAKGERNPPAVSTSPTSTTSAASVPSAASGQRNSDRRSWMVNDGRPSDSAAMGGAMGISYQRCDGQTCSAGSPLAAPRSAASRVAGSSSGSKDCAGFRAATRKPAARSSVRRRAETHVFPISVPVPTTATRRRGRTPVRGRRGRAPAPARAGQPHQAREATG